MSNESSDAHYVRGADGVLVPTTPVAHRDEEYDQAAFDILVKMQRRHFWYRGRHRFLLQGVDGPLGIDRLSRKTFGNRFRRRMRRLDRVPSRSCSGPV